MNDGREANELSRKFNAKAPTRTLQGDSRAILINSAAGLSFTP
jgi:hypothetical protein